MIMECKHVMFQHRWLDGPIEMNMPLTLADLADTWSSYVEDLKSSFAAILF